MAAMPTFALNNTPRSSCNFKRMFSMRLFSSLWFGTSDLAFSALIILFMTSIISVGAHNKVQA